MTLPRRTLAMAGGALAALVAAFAWGRSSAPVKTVTKVETKTEWKDRIVEKVVTVKAKDVQRRVVTRTETQPSGASVTLKVEDTNSHADLGSVSSFTGTSVGTSSSKAESETSSRAGWRLGVAADWDGVHGKPDSYQFEIDRRIVGPLWLGVRGSTNRTAGLAVGMEW